MEECLLDAMYLNLKRMVNAIFFCLQIYYSAGTAAGFGGIFAFVNRSNKLRKLHTAVASGNWCGAERQRRGASGSPLM